MSIKIKNKNNKKFERELSDKINLFDKAPDHCLTCNKEFDKTNKEMVTSWYVVVRNKEEKDLSSVQGPRLCFYTSPSTVWT